jgi:hypothetical protein
VVRTRPIAATACVRTRAATLETRIVISMKKKKAATLIGSVIVKVWTGGRKKKL